MKIILYQPQIPQNTGNIIRTCRVTGSQLMLVCPLGFRFNSRMLKRAGLDYALDMEIEVIDDLESYLGRAGHFYLLSSHAETSYAEVEYRPETNLVFGSETQGLPSHFWEKYKERFITIPMVENVRCLNLASSVAAVVYEGWRQMGFQGAKNAFESSVQ